MAKSNSSCPRSAGGSAAAPAAAQGQSDTSFKTTLIAEPRSNALILRAANPARVAQVRALVDKLDQPPVPGSSAASGNIHVVYLKNADATKLATTLRARVAAGVTVVLSSHQLDLVQDLCTEIVMIDHGRQVLAGSVAELRSSSGRRQLRLGLPHGVPRDWLAPFPEVTVASDDADALRLTLPTGVDPLAVLDAARAAGPVTDFGLDLPTLSQLFLAVAGDGAAEEDLR